MEIISAREAFNNGLTRYFSGKVCCHGHVAERMISNGCCVECLKENRKRSREDVYEATKVWRLKNPQARTEEAKRYRKKHPEKVAEKSKRWREKNLDASREREKFYARSMRARNPEAQNLRTKRCKEKKDLEKEKLAGRPRPENCEICGLNEFRIVFDHCHNKGHFRGWICDRCNRVLGTVKDSCELLTKLKDYLERDFEQNNNQSQE